MPGRRIFATRTLSPEQCESFHALAVQVFVATAVLMIAALILMSFTQSSLTEAQSLNAATEDKLLAMTTIESRLIDSDGALNGLVINHDPWFAARIVSNRKELTQTTAWLGNALRDDPALYGLYQRVSSHLSKRQKLYEYLADPAHSDEVARVERSQIAAEERRVTDEVRGRLWDLLKRERAERFAHAAMIREARDRIWVAVGAVALALVAGAISLFLSRLARAPRPE